MRGQEQMDIRVFDRNSDIAPLLVDLYDTHEIYKIAQDKTPEARAELTGIVSDLFKAELSFSEQEIIADILIELLRQAEKDLRAALSETLCASDTVPLRLVLQLANDEIDVAQYILRESSILGELDLAYLIKYKSAGYWKEIAKRKDINDNVTRMLIATGDRDTVLTLLDNKKTEIGKNNMLAAADLTKIHKDLAVPLLRRPEVDHDVAARLYHYVGEQLKRHIIETYTIHSADIIERLDDTIAELASLKQQSLHPSPAMILDARKQAERRMLTLEVMIDTLRRKQVARFIAQFSVYTDQSVDEIFKVLRDKTGQRIIYLCKANSILKPECITIYILTNVVRSNSRVIETKMMEQIARLYDRL